MSTTEPIAELITQPITAPTTEPIISWTTWHGRAGAVFGHAVFICNVKP